MKRIWRSIRFGVAGWASVTRSQWNMRFHLVAATMAIALCALLRVSAVEWVLILIVIALVLSAECINTAIERLADRVCPEQDPLIKQCKDAAAGGVLITACLSVIVGAIIFIPHLIELLRQWELMTN